VQSQQSLQQSLQSNRAIQREYTQSSSQAAQVHLRRLAKRRLAHQAVNKRGQPRVCSHAAHLSRTPATHAQAGTPAADGCWPKHARRQARLPAPHALLAKVPGRALKVTRRFS